MRATQANAEMFGFRWDQVDIIRAGELPDGKKVISIQTDHADIDIYVSKGGRKIRVYRGFEELL